MIQGKTPPRLPCPATPGRKDSCRRPAGHAPQDSHILKPHRRTARHQNKTAPQSPSAVRPAFGVRFHFYACAASRHCATALRTRLLVRRTARHQNKTAPQSPSAVRPAFGVRFHFYACAASRHCATALRTRLLVSVAPATPSICGPPAAITWSTSSGSACPPIAAVSA